MDPTYGYTLPTLLEVGAPPAPADLAEFWTGRYAQARAVAPAPTTRPSADTMAGFDVFDVEYTSVGGVRLGAWLAVPVDGPVERGLVHSHGYGGRLAPEAVVPVERAAVLFPVARGLGSRGLVEGIPSTAEAHVLHGIASRETYVHGGCAADVWCAVTALCELVPAAATRVDYLGGSFGGGIGALAAPWDPRIAAVCLSVPSFGNHPLRVTLPCTGSGEAVRAHVADHPEALETLRYFDAAATARHLRVPTHVAAALADPAVPPPGQFAIHNAVAGPRELYVREYGHTEHPGMADAAAALLASQRAFLARG
ncbi:acetylxylan esterase [Cellulomonas wangsupingiae]|uniref:Acetylxylan esterase n=1 Tax=Cellulomonas wangsupingiae TaxID=2968085 RepID=A0ABY5K2N2_9CELL|nr:acetylxylan esterase [Cellulomonas wangsupingiae]MCC2336654.1 acetylxylan esterase [Cellulomonas wangsupingiae]MCM0640505.1 acetylxylan esterase [Cellulomonas wangsupingiae]UUI64469.1 acetylxylan esterase [Cellulomonas wangsupingiae]